MCRPVILVPSSRLSIEAFDPVTLAILPAGGFITLGLLLALINRIGEWNARRHGAPAPLPVNLDCRHCTMCGKGKEAVEKLKG